ncbi:hypothetical protein GCM10025771_37750 [Niveibacterium umoris]|uniref:Diguanylate cyclase (GGDEF)-like protein n=1 Tax=Niveibacterium umoris TaxID=1193620 RepID=A0A840BJE3_9RHOO|nr:bifunctional diguanylate cyclase/phosphodiesterase [Niveibacterium umoris]MBB4011026.1 diguanylate cyclase (GGDEF)-like protein [Niveibacterium umoris]
MPPEHIDVLTGFLDRAGCLAAVSAWVQSPEATSTLMSVIWLDLDRFKLVNESFGHLGGDAVIARMATRLAERLAGRAQPCRMGGDEFVFLARGVDAAAAQLIAADLLDCVKLPLEVGNIRLYPTGSVGIAVLEPKEDAVSVLERADRAMVEAKRLGGDRTVLSGEERVAGRLGVLLAREELVVENKLHMALERGGLALHYQPIVALDGSIHAVEALMRCSADGETVSPVRFIPVAEKTGLVVRLGEWSMLYGAMFAHRLAALGLGTKVAINVSRAQLTAPKFSQALHAALLCSDAPPELIELELTESLFMDVSEVVQSNLLAAKMAGVSLAIDDFGTGYSCLANLKDIPASKLKIDRAFIKVLPHDLRALAIVRAITNMARELGMTVVAEGVETPEQQAALEDVGVDAIQGFLHARPMDGDALITWLKQRKQA